MAKHRHTPGTLPYFRVSGERRMLNVDPSHGEVGVEIVLPAHTRFESIELGDSERFATSVYKAEGIVCEIHEISR